MSRGAGVGVGEGSGIGIGIGIHPSRVGGRSNEFGAATDSSWYFPGSSASCSNSREWPPTF